jgi:hypothetical protein
MDIEANLRRLEERIARACHRAGRLPQEVTLVAVTKTVSADMVRHAFHAGVRHFGENRVQEARDKLPRLVDISHQATWHMVGHLQSNKARLCLRLFDWVDSLDSLRLAMLLNRWAESRVPVLLQVNIAGEGSKSGILPQETAKVLEDVAQLPNLEVKGLMGIAPWTRDEKVVRSAFRHLRRLRDSLGLDELSMGMSDDFEMAIEEGATMVRIGRAIFGERTTP